MGADDKVTYMQTKIAELRAELQKEQQFKQNIFNELEEQEAKESTLVVENEELKKTVGEQKEEIERLEDRIEEYVKKESSLTK